MESREAREVGLSSTSSKLLFLMYTSTDNTVNILLSDQSAHITGHSIQNSKYLNHYSIISAL